jgi:hypothetical protein
MSEEELAAIAAVLFLATNERPKKPRQTISAWAKAARDYDEDDRCSPKY